MLLHRWRTRAQVISITWMRLPTMWRLITPSRLWRLKAARPPLQTSLIQIPDHRCRTCGITSYCYQRDIISDLPLTMITIKQLLVKPRIQEQRVIAPSVTKSAIVNAVRNMNFYATQDCDAKVDLISIRGSWAHFHRQVCSQYQRNAHGCHHVYRFCHHPRDVWCSGKAAYYRLKIDSVIGSTLSFTNISQNNLSTGYYYIDITNGSNRIVTSPIWYTRDDAAAGGPLPVKLSAFTVQKWTIQPNWTGPPRSKPTRAIFGGTQHQWQHLEYHCNGCS